MSKLSLTVNIGSFTPADSVLISADLSLQQHVSVVSGRCFLPTTCRYDGGSTMTATTMTATNVFSEGGMTGNSS